MDWLSCCACAARLDAAPIFVSAFPDRAEFRKHVADIAWETEVWIASDPDHLVHFNGEKFLGPPVDGEPSHPPFVKALTGHGQICKICLT